MPEEDALLEKLRAEERIQGGSTPDQGRAGLQARIAMDLVRYERAIEDILVRHDAEDIIESMLEPLRDILEADCAEFLTIDDGGLRADAAVGIERPRDVCIPSNAVPARVAASGNAQSCLEADVDDVLVAQGMRRVAAAPVHSRGKVVGVLQVADARQAPYSPRELRLVQAVARRLGQSLEHARSLREIEAQCTKAQRAAAFKTTLLHLVVHDIKTPLTALQAECQIIATGRLGPAEQAAALQRTLENLHRLGLLLDDLLDMARMDAHHFTLQRSWIDLGDVARRVVELFHAKAQRKRIHLSADLAPASAWADGRRTEQVLTNLVSNALRYTEEGGHVHVRSGAHPQAAFVSVADDGCGIDEQQIAQLFQPFEQVVEGGQGTALGLHLARIVTQAQGGRLLVHSEGRGRGSTFTLELPAQRPETGRR